MNVQVIEKNGKPEWAVLPYRTYEQLVEQIEMLQDIQDFDAVTRAIANGQEELVPADIVYALLDQNPIKVWREYRGLTQQELAAVVGISTSYLSQLETGARSGSTAVLQTIAGELGLMLDDLV